MNLLTKADDTETQKDPTSFTLLFFCFNFYHLKNQSEANTVSRGDMFHPSPNQTTEEFASELSQQCHYIQGWEMEVLGQNDSSDLHWRSILEHEEPCPKCACTSLWTMPGPMFHQVNPMLSTFWNTVQILSLKMHGQNFPYLSLTRSKKTKTKYLWNKSHNWFCEFCN